MSLEGGAEGIQGKLSSMFYVICVRILRHLKPSFTLGLYYIET
jgi:hypothetical protein